MTNIIETKFGTLVNTSKIAAGSASSVKKSGAFYNFSIVLIINAISVF